MAVSIAVVTGSQAMQQTLLSCQSLCTMSLAQIVDEDKIDPFPARTTADLEELLAAARQTKEVLSRESLIYSKTADFSKYADAELAAMSEFVRETARMLSVVLAGGKEHFFNGQGLSVTQELRKMDIYMDEKVKEYLMIDKLIPTLEIKQKYGGKNNAKRNVALSPFANHPDVEHFKTVDATKGSSSHETLQKLAMTMEKFAVQCRETAKTRAFKSEDRVKKLEAKEALLVEVDTLMPLLRQHVLRIGLAKVTSKEWHGGRHESLGTLVDHSRVLTSLFTHQAVAEAHITVEQCRERITHEVLFRRAKVEKRLEKEMAREEAVAIARAATTPIRNAQRHDHTMTVANESQAEQPMERSLSRSLSLTRRPSQQRLSQSPPRPSGQTGELIEAHLADLRDAKSRDDSSDSKKKRDKRERRKKKGDRDDSPGSSRGGSKKNAFPTRQSSSSPPRKSLAGPDSPGSSRRKKGGTKDKQREAREKLGDRGYDKTKAPSSKPKVGRASEPGLASPGGTSARASMAASGLQRSRGSEAFSSPRKPRGGNDEASRAQQHEDNVRAFEERALSARGESPRPIAMTNVRPGAAATPHRVSVSSKW